MIKYINQIKRIITFNIFLAILTALVHTFAGFVFFEKSIYINGTNTLIFVVCYVVCISCQIYVVHHIFVLKSLLDTVKNIKTLLQTESVFKNNMISDDIINIPLNVLQGKSYTITTTALLSKVLMGLRTAIIKSKTK